MMVALFCAHVQWVLKINNYGPWTISVDHLSQLFVIILGGGVSKKLELYRNFINIKTPLIAAKLKNNAGIIGAAVFAKKMVDLSSKV